jgi:parallel beta-helix repeat protein
MKLCLIASLVFLQAAALPAATLTVLNINNSGPGSLRQSVIDAAASPGADIIDFAPALSGQTLVLASEIALSMISAGNLSVDASSLPGCFTLSGGGICRIFSVSGSGGTVTLTGLTLRNGNGVGGSVSGSGGAINKSSGTLTLDRCIFRSHSTNVGGAIANNNGALTLLHCTLDGNSANAQGGAIFNGGTATLVQSTLSGNTAANEGGAIRNIGTLTLTQCTLSGNSVSGSGGAIYHAGGSSLSLTHCTLSGNSAANLGGGIFNSLSSVTLTNSIVAKNTSFNGADIYNAGSSPFGPSTVTRLGANIIQSHINSGNLASDSGPPAIMADPLLAPLGDYGGPTQTLALLADSPARDAAVDSTLTFDQRDFPSPVEGDPIDQARASTLASASAASTSLPPPRAKSGLPPPLPPTMGRWFG